jgi:hypothetical protein
VILEEIKIDEDNPDVLVHELFTQSFWKDHPLGWPILGTTKTVASSTRRSSSPTTATASTAATWSSPRPATWTTTSLPRKWRPSSLSGRRRDAA